MDMVIAAGVESMSRVPMGLPLAKLAHEANGFGSPNSPKMEDALSTAIQFSQFVGAEMIAKKYNLSKDELDALRL